MRGWRVTVWVYMHHTRGDADPTPFEALAFLGRLLAMQQMNPMVRNCMRMNEKPMQSKTAVPPPRRNYYDESNSIFKSLLDPFHHLPRVIFSFPKPTDIFCYGVRGRGCSQAICPALALVAEHTSYARCPTRRKGCAILAYVRRLRMVDGKGGWKDVIGSHSSV